jgi:hypothetical protein
MNKASSIIHFVVEARLLRRLLFAGIVLGSVLVTMSSRAESPKQPKGASTNPDQAGRQPVHIVIKSRSQIKQVFTYFPYPAVPNELQGYAGSKVNGTGLYRLKVDPQGVVTQVTVLKGFTVAASYDERFSDIKGNPVPALDKITLQALTRWRAKPGPMRIVDLYWSFGTQPWVNYGK